MKSYYCFIEKDNIFDIIELKGETEKKTFLMLRDYGFKVKVILSKKKYQEYQRSDVSLFFSKYWRRFNDKNGEETLKIMYGKTIK